MNPDIHLPPEGGLDDTRREYLTGFSDLDSRIVILAAVSVFIHAYLCGAVVILAVIMALSSREKRRLVADAPHVRWLALFAVLVLAVPVAHGNWTGLAVAAAIIIVLYFFLYAATVMSESLFHAVTDAACIISLVYFLIALLQRLLGLSPRSPSTFQNANYYSHAMELVLLLSIYRHQTAGNRAHKRFTLVVIATNIAALYMADSRSAWPAVFAGIFVYFLMSGAGKSLLALAFFAAAGILAALAFPSFFPRLESIGLDRIVRLKIWQEAISGIRQHPVFGVGAMGYYHLSQTHRYYHSHNMILESLISFGAVGTALLGTFFTLMFRSLTRRFLADRKQAVYPLIFAAATVTAIHGLTDVTILWPQTGILFVLILAGAGIGRKTMLPPSSSPSSS